jgi:ribosomal protein S18 acetylase RimI-like enzyme
MRTVNALIRQAIPADAAVIHAVVDAAYRHYVARIGKKPGPMLDDYDARVAAGQAWVLEQDGRIAGILVLEDRGHEFLLDNIAVAPDAQGRGLGRALIAFAENQARGAGYTEVKLYTHVMMTENIALYTRLGFRETGRVEEKGFSRVYMTKRLT